MKPPRDPISEAEVYLAYGQRSRAVRVLEDAIRKDSTRTDLKQRLAAIISEHSLRSQPQHIGRPFVLLHALVAWLLYAGSLGVLVYLLLQGREFVPDFPLPDSAGIGIPLLLLGVALLCVILLGVGITLFSLLWFAYLKLFVGVENIPSVEAKVKAFILLQYLEPIYGKIKKHVYGL